MKHANVLSLKYRPQRFGDVVGQSVACRILSKASVTDAVAPAYILSGTRGVGKTTLARIFAKSLLCVHAPVEEPCNSCSHCERISKGQFVDVVELDAASHRSIDDIRDLRDNVGFSPMEGRYKIFILDEAHMLTKEAYNALLKTLEEPPPFVVFIFASTDIQKFPATIISRCQHIVLKSVPVDVLTNHLSSVLDKEGVEYQKEALELIARRGFGSVRDSLSFLGQSLVGVPGVLTKESVEEMLGLATEDIYISIVEAIFSGNALAIVNIVHSLLEKGVDIKYFLQELTNLFRILFLVKEYKEQALALFSLSDAYTKAVLHCVEHTSLQHIHLCWQMILHGQKQILESVEPSIALEFLLMNIVSIRSLLPSSEYLQHESLSCVQHTPKSSTVSQSLSSDDIIINSTKDNVHTSIRDVSIETKIDSSSKNVYSGGNNKRMTQDRDISASNKEPVVSSMSFREKMLSQAQSNISDLEKQSSEGEGNEGAIAIGRVGADIVIPSKEYQNKFQYPILGIIEEEFNTSYTYLPRSFDE